MAKDFCYRHLVRNGRATKKEVQKLLRFIDKSEHKKSGCWFMANKKKCCRGLIGVCGGYPFQYSKHCLEKWNTILAEVMNTYLPTYNEEQMGKIGAYFMRFSTLWDYWQPAAHKDTRDVWKFKNRKHFPSINFAIRIAHKMLNIKGFDRAFPIPNTKSSTSKLQDFWVHMFDALKIDGVPLSKKKQPVYRQLTLPELISPNNGTVF